MQQERDGVVRWSAWLDDDMKIITIKSYEMCSRSRWGWHTFRDGKDYKGKIIGFRFLGIGLCWRKSSNTRICDIAPKQDTR
jgi:hypothetical protein